MTSCSCHGQWGLSDWSFNTTADRPQLWTGPEIDKTATEMNTAGPDPVSWLMPILCNSFPIFWSIIIFFACNCLQKMIKIRPSRTMDHFHPEPRTKECVEEQRPKQASPLTFFWSCPGHRNRITRRGKAPLQFKWYNHGFTQYGRNVNSISNGTDF
jgi:hypothetical protein